MSENVKTEFKVILKSQIMEQINKIKDLYKTKASADIENLKIIPLDKVSIDPKIPTLTTDIKSYLVNYRDFVQANFVDGLNTLVVEVLNEIINELNT